MNDMQVYQSESELILANQTKVQSTEMVKNVTTTILDNRTVTTRCVVIDMSQQYDMIIGMGDLLSLGITITGLPNGIDPLKDQSDNDMLCTPMENGNKKALIPKFTELIMDLLLVNRKIKITQWAKFKFNDGYVSLDLSKVDFTQLKVPSRNYVSWRHEGAV